MNNMESKFFRNTYNIFIFNLLNRLKINYETLWLYPNQVICTNGIYIYQRYLPSVYDSYMAIIDAVKYLSSGDIPDKKVFLSRKKNFRVKSKEFLFGNVDPQTLMFQDDNRLDDFELVENFFKGLGFDIVYPEDFGSFEEQAKFFTTVKFLAGTTGAGLVNSIFMPEGGTVLELSTPLLGHGREDVHDFYKEISFCKNHTYIAIQNFRNSETILNYIKKNEKLVELLNA